MGVQAKVGLRAVHVGVTNETQAAKETQAANETQSVNNTQSRVVHASGSRVNCSPGNSTANKLSRQVPSEAVAVVEHPHEDEELGEWCQTDIGAWMKRTNEFGSV